MSWAFAMVVQSDAQLSVVLTRLAERHAGDFNTQDLRMTLWTLSGRRSLKDAWSFVDRAQRVGVSFSPFCFGALLTECEQQ